MNENEVRILRKSGICEFDGTCNFQHNAVPYIKPFCYRRQFCNSKIIFPKSIDERVDELEKEIRIIKLGMNDFEN